MTKNNTVYMLVGIPGSGKSTYREKLVKNLPGAVVLCPDDYLYTDGKYLWTAERCASAWSLCNSEYLRSLRAGHPIVWDATFVSPKARKSVLDLARKHGTPVVAVAMGTPHSTCMERNAQRPEDRRVPEASMASMISRYVVPSSTEGFLDVLSTP